MLLWKKRFGKAVRVKDFAGRTINKSAYDDRKSEFGWNLDHILPQSKGGKDAEHNLICCHIQTNDDKANKFPHFATNDKKFEIIKVQNHYEIKELNPNNTKDEELNLYDSASGIRFFKKLKGIQNKKLFVGTVEIELFDVTTLAVIDFCKEIFDVDNMNFDWGDSSVVITIKNYNMPTNDDIQSLLDKCILFNTYAKNYFSEANVIRGWHIFYGVTHCDNKLESLCDDLTINTHVNFDIVINELVKINCDAEKDLKDGTVVGRDSHNNALYEYNYTYTNLAENLRKEFNK